MHLIKELKNGIEILVGQGSVHKYLGGGLGKMEGAKKVLSCRKGGQKVFSSKWGVKKVWSNWKYNES